MNNHHHKLNMKLNQEHQKDLLRSAEMARLAADCQPMHIPGLAQRALDKAGNLLIATGQRLKLPDNIAAPLPIEPNRVLSAE